MDLAYDHIQEESYPKDDEGSSTEKKVEQQPSLNAELQGAYRAFSASPWGARIGGFFGNVVKQGESVYREAQQELTAVGQDATKGLTDLRDTIMSRTRSLSLNVAPTSIADEPGKEPTSKDQDATTETPTTAKDLTSDEAIEDSETVLSRLRTEATKRLKDLQKAEDAADEALLRFGTNLRDFLKDAISIAPPSGDGDNQGNAVLFESKDAQGKRVIHTSRFDAQLHVIHTTSDSFTKDPTGSEYGTWSQNFDIDKKTEDISKDLAKYPELRTTMENLVPDQVPYAEFWARYYYLRHGIETAEARRRDLLKAASAEEEVAWDEDSDDEAGSSKPKIARPASVESSRTIHPPATQNHLKPSEPRKSNDEKSQPDSDASYDVVGATSGVPSQAPSSPKESRGGDNSDEEDWE